MVLSSDTSPVFSLKPWILLNLSFLIFASANSVTFSRYTSFIYEKCSNETRVFPPQILLSSLSQELVEKSSKSMFYQTDTGDDRIAISGLFQCRGDITNDNCHDCIQHALQILSCAKTLPARIQLSGCYMNLELEPELDRIERILIDTTMARKDSLQHKKCGESKTWFGGFDEIRNEAFAAVSSCVMSSGAGYCETRQDGLYVVGQCEGSLEACECGECVSNAFQVAQDECWDSDSGEIYMDTCFISYSYDEFNGGQGNSYQGSGAGGGSGKLIAIGVGVAAAFGVLFALCYCIRSSRKKREDW